MEIRVLTFCNHSTSTLIIISISNGYNIWKLHTRTFSMYTHKYIYNNNNNRGYGYEMYTNYFANGLSAYLQHIDEATKIVIVFWVL